MKKNGFYGWEEMILEKKMKCKHDWKLFASSNIGDYIFYCKKCDTYKEFKEICLECFICGMKIDYNGKETKCYCENCRRGLDE